MKEVELHDEHWRLQALNVLKTAKVIAEQLLTLQTTLDDDASKTKQWVAFIIIWLHFFSPWKILKIFLNFFLWFDEWNKAITIQSISNLFKNRFVIKINFTLIQLGYLEPTSIFFLKERNKMQRWRWWYLGIRFESLYLQWERIKSFGGFWSIYGLCRRKER